MECFKRIYAEDLAAALLEWDYTQLDDHELYQALYELGYDWNGEGWVPAGAQEK